MDDQLCADICLKMPHWFLGNPISFSNCIYRGALVFHAFYLDVTYMGKKLEVSTTATELLTQTLSECI